MRSLKELNAQMSVSVLLMKKKEDTFKTERKEFLEQHDNDAFSVYTAFLALVYVFVLLMLDPPLIQSLLSNDLSGEVMLSILGLVLVFTIVSFAGMMTVVFITLIILITNPSFFKRFVWFLYPSFGERAKRVLQEEYSSVPELQHLYDAWQEVSENHKLLQEEYEKTDYKLKQKLAAVIVDDAELVKYVQYLWTND